MKKILLLIFQLYVISSVYAQNEVSLEAPSTAPQYGVAEFVFRVQGVTIRNPFTDIEIKGTYVSGNTRFSVDGFADSQDGSLFRLRFSPEIVNTTYTYDISFKGSGVTKNFTGKLVSTAPQDKGPVIVDPLRPKHFIYAETKEPFFHIGCTEYHLLDISNDDSQVEATINYCQQYGFNKIRFLLSGYPREYDNRTSDDVDHGVAEDPWKAPNYGSLPGKVNPLPAWLGKPHDYDFERFNVIHWQRVDRAVRLLKEKGIIATCIIQIEKQNLPKEIGELTANEYRLYQYAVARLSAFNNVWWDLGNEHNEFRKPAWGNTMGDFVKEKDPYDRLASAHGYADFFYSDSPWADFIITQQYGDVDSVHNWALKYYKVPKPYVNEEYGYEGRTEKPIGHGMNSEWVRKCHWAIAMAGGYGTYGDWSNGISYFYMGIPGPGKAALHLKYLKSFFESLPYNEMTPSDDLTTNGYCLSKPQELYILYLPEGGFAEINLSNSAKKQLSAKWFDPVTGEWSLKNVLRKGKNLVNAPSEKDWVCLISTGKTKKKK